MNPVIFHHLGRISGHKQTNHSCGDLCSRDTSDRFWLRSGKQCRTSVTVKMRGLLFLLSALFLLESTDGHTPYEQLSQHDREIIDKAITQANGKHGLNKHLDYDSILNTDPGKGLINVLLKPTSCNKMTPSVHQKHCKIKNKATPKVSCVECHGSMSCFRLKHLEEITQAISECLNPPPPDHLTGERNFLSRKSANQQRTGCLGCI